MLSHWNLTNQSSRSSAAMKILHLFWTTVPNKLESIQLEVNNLQHEIGLLWNQNWIWFRNYGYFKSPDRFDFLFQEMMTANNFFGRKGDGYKKLLGFRKKCFKQEGGTQNIVAFHILLSPTYSPLKFPMITAHPSIDHHHEVDLGNHPHRHHFPLTFWTLVCCLVFLPQPVPQFLRHSVLLCSSSPSWRPSLTPHPSFLL